MKIMMKSLKEHCLPKGISIKKVQLVQCNHRGKPAWAQNDAMMEAYIDGMDFGYRINDDTLLKTPGWTEAFINVLSSMDPPNVGVVGPTHSGGNMNILTYDFTSSDQNVKFEYHYPELLNEWFVGILFDFME